MTSCAKQGTYLSGILGKFGWGTFRSARIFCVNKGGLFLVGQGSYSRNHLATRFMGLRGWIIVEKPFIDHFSTKGQLCDILIKFLTRPIFTELLNATINRV